MNKLWPLCNAFIPRISRELISTAVQILVSPHCIYSLPAFYQHISYRWELRGGAFSRAQLENLPWSRRLCRTQVEDSPKGCEDAEDHWHNPPQRHDDADWGSPLLEVRSRQVSTRVAGWERFLSNFRELFWITLTLYLCVRFVFICTQRVKML